MYKLFYLARGKKNLSKPFTPLFSVSFSSVKTPRLAYSLSRERTYVHSLESLKDSEKSIILQQKAIKWHALKFANPRGRRGGGRNERPQGSEPVRDPYVKYRDGIRADGRILFRLVKILMRASGRDYLMTRVSPVHTKLARYIGWHAETGRPGGGGDDEKRETRAGHADSPQVCECSVGSTQSQSTIVWVAGIPGDTYLHAHMGDEPSHFETLNKWQEIGEGWPSLHRKVFPSRSPGVRAGCALVSTYSDPSGKSKQVPHRSPFWITPKRERRQDDEARGSENGWGGVFRFCSFARRPSTIVYRSRNEYRICAKNIPRCTAYLSFGEEGRSWNDVYCIYIFVYSRSPGEA
jgi:hypothetical protein